MQGPGYTLANAAVEGAKGTVETTRAAADAANTAANFALQQTISAQDQLVNQAQAALDLVDTASNELLNSQLAQRALDDFNNAEASVLSGLQTAVDGLADCAEKVAFDGATAALAAANANTSGIDLAVAAVNGVRDGVDTALQDVGAWLTNHEKDILALENVQVSGNLRGLALHGMELDARIVGSFAEHAIDFVVGFVPGKGDGVAKAVYDKVMADVRSATIVIPKST